jgi:hypothetical protein
MLRILTASAMLAFCVLCAFWAEEQFTLVAWALNALLWAVNLWQAAVDAWQLRHRGPGGLYVPGCPCTICAEIRLDEPMMTERFDEAVASGLVRIVEIRRK